MKLLTASILKRLPDLYATQDVPLKDKLVICKFFTPDSNWTWWIVEGGLDGNDMVLWGLVEGFECEWGYVSLGELSSSKGPLGLPIERDMYFTPTKISDIPQISSKYYSESS